MVPLDRPPQPQVVLLNGLTSSGKTSLACALQDLLDEVWLYVGFDTYLSMVGTRYRRNKTLWLNHKDQILSGYCRALRAYLSGGLNLLLDNVLPFQSRLLGQLVVALEDHEVYFVEVSCPVAILALRERARGDRDIGLARWQSEHLCMDRHEHYDLRLDTSRLSPQAAAADVKARLESGHPPTAFTALRASYGESAKAYETGASVVDQPLADPSIDPSFGKR